MKFMISYALVIFKCRHEVQYTNELSHLHGCVINYCPISLFLLLFPLNYNYIPFPRKEGEVKRILITPLIIIFIVISLVVSNSPIS